MKGWRKPSAMDLSMLRKTQHGKDRVRTMSLVSFKLICERSGVCTNKVDLCRIVNRTTSVRRNFETKHDIPLAPITNSSGCRIAKHTDLSAPGEPHHRTLLSDPQPLRSLLRAYPKHSCISTRLMVQNICTLVQRQMAPHTDRGPILSRLRGA